MRDYISKLDLVIGCKSLRGIMFVVALKDKIKTVKELFMMEIEDGIPTLIPKELSIENYPLSYRFYDPIIAIVKENLSKEKWKVLNNRL